jgi:predicted regulator of Ras-like GTPase activity (Roadblock/LC7/MglB family)
MAEQGGTGSTENLDRVLADLRALSGDIESCGVLSKDGELLFSSHGEGVDRERVAAMVAALANLAERVARENGKDHASQVTVKVEGRHVLLVRLEAGGALVATTGSDARVGLVLDDMRNARAEVEKALGGRR